MLHSEKYVALYQEYNENSTIISGNGTIQFMPEPAPTPSPFDYNGSYGYKSQYPTINDNLKVFFGDYKYYQTPATYYVGTNYGGVYTLPYTLESNLTIQDIDANGTVTASYDNQTILLKIGDAWQSPVIARIENQTFPVDVDNNMVNQPFFVGYNSSWKVENLGIYDKSNLT